MATVPFELYELFEKKLGKEEAKEAIKLIEKAKEQKSVVKEEVRDELRKELVTKEEFFGKTGKLRQEMETLRKEMETIRQELKGEIKALDERITGEIKVLRILIYITLATVILMNKGTIEYIVNLFKMIK